MGSLATLGPIFENFNDHLRFQWVKLTPVVEFWKYSSIIIKSEILIIWAL
jgi:hypothetical protein